MDNAEMEMYCGRCEEDVKASLVLNIASIDEISRAVHVELSAICKNCGTTLVMDSATMSFGFQ